MRKLVLTLVAITALCAVSGVLWFAQRVPEQVVEAASVPSAPRETAPPPSDANVLVAPDHGDPVAVAAESASTAPLNSAAARTEVSSTAFDVLDELRRAREHGLIRDGDLSSWLAFAYLRNGDPHGALALLERCDSKDANVWWNVAQVLANEGDRAGQERALSRALLLMPDNQAFVGTLAQIDPQRAISIFQRQLSQQPPPGEPGLRRRLAQALANAGRGAEAQALLAAMLDDNPQDVETMHLFSMVDPAGAEARLEAMMTTAQDPSEWRSMLANLYVERGDLAGAQRLIDRAERAGQTIAPDEWGQLADTLLATGSAPQAVDAWTRAIALEHGDPDQWVHALTEYAPEQLMSLLEARVQSDESANDEYWGSLADAYWRAGRKLDAQSAWMRARELDPKDDEWPMRLEAIAAGHDPFQ
jgi:tetratricopeptide (TPR) repeat protein